MISTSEIQRLIQRDSTGREILSLFLDMSVTSDNRRMHHVFLNKEKARFAELESERERHHREPLGAAFARIERWIDESFEPTNRGIAIFTEIGGDWFEAFQFPVPLRNRLVILDGPVIGPLSELLHQHPRYGIIIVDREHLHLLSVQMGTIGESVRSAPDAIPTPHDVQAGGYSQKDYQKRKAEETRHFFRMFADDVARFDQRIRPDHYVLLGTVENRRHFAEFLPREIAARIIHTDGAPPADNDADVLRQLQPIFDGLAEQQEAAALNLLQDRVRQSHFATSGFHDTLIHLQEGKVERLVVARDLQRDGVQCTRCGFYLVRRDGACPYCGGGLRDGIDLVESMLRIAADQDVGIEFVAADTMRDHMGVGALLRF